MNTTASLPDGIVLVPGHFFFLHEVTLDPAVAAASQIELALEELSPFPLAQLYYGHLTAPDGRTALAYATYRRRIEAEALREWADAAAVVPDFIALCGAPPTRPEIVVLVHTGGLTGAAWDGRAAWPVAWQMEAANEPTEEQIEALVMELRRRGGLSDPSVRRLAGPVGAGLTNEGGAVLRVAGEDTAQLTPAALAAADVRDKSFLQGRAVAARQRRSWWTALLGVAALGLLAAGIELAAGIGAVWNHRRQEQAKRQETEVTRIETAQTVADRVEDLTARRERPLEWLATVSAVRPRSVQFLRAISQNNRTLEIEMRTPDAAEAGAYETALRKLGDVERVALRDLRTQEGLTTFVVAVTFKAPAQPTREAKS